MKLTKGRTFWNTPIVVLETKKQKWGIILFAALFVPVFLLIFQPFGVNNYDQTHQIEQSFLFAALGFGLVSAFTLCLSEFIITPYLFRKKTRGTLLLSMFLTLGLLSTSIYLYYNVLGSFHDWTWISYFGFIRDVSALSIIPIGVGFLYFSYRDTKNNYKNLLKKSESSAFQKKMITLESDNGKETISFPLNELRYIEAQDNYVSVYYLMDGFLKKQLLRATMKTLEMKLKNESVLRCHRSYLVHLDAVIKAKGDGHQLRLYLSHVDSPIPVSRSYTSLFKEIMAVHHK